jgi:cytosine deaminase
MTDSRPQPPGPPDPATPPPGGAAPAPATLLLAGARLADGRTVDVRLAGGRIEAVGTAGSLGAAPAAEGEGNERPRDRAAEPAGPSGPSGRVDLTGYLLLPAPAEPHAHLADALTAETPGPPSEDPRDIQRRVTEAALLQLGHGATAVRSHVRVGDVAGLRALEAVLQAARALRGLVEVQAVAVPRLLTGAAGADGLAVLRDALAMGATVAGGSPALDPDPSGYAEALLGLAAEHGVPVDLHSDGGDPARLARLAAMAGGLRPGVAIGPCGGLARLPLDAAARAAGQLAAAGITVVALPQGGCGTPTGAPPSGPYAAGPGAEGASLREGTPAAAVRLLRAAGVRVAAGSGALRDLANPVGRGDPLEAAYLLASHGACPAPEAYDAVAARAREVMGLPEVRVEAGFPAELLAVRAAGVEAALSLGYSRVVVHRGRVVARTSAVREFTDTFALDLPRQARPRRDPA